jgi:hypothetical protein
MAAMHETVEPTRIVVIARTVRLDHRRVKKTRCQSAGCWRGRVPSDLNRSGTPVDACRPVEAHTLRADCPGIMTAI